MSRFTLRGVGTALVTPFQPDMSVDHGALRALVAAQVAAGIDFLVACGTTGEAAAMNEDEQAAVIETVVAAAGGRIPVVAGAGGPDTRGVLNRARRFAALGVEAILSVTPYYNKPTAAGLLAHYQYIADGCEKPLILYNVPGRTGCNLEPESTADLARHPNIVAIKDANATIEHHVRLAAAVPDDFVVFSGDDAATLPVMALGGVGVISVASNLFPGRMVELARACASGNWETARKLNRLLSPAFGALFIESNPIPVKAAMAARGDLAEVYRLPMTPISPANRETLLAALRAAGV